MELFKAMSDKAYEAVHFFHDAETGLRAIIAIHDTTFGPALGGARALSTYANEEAALVDALRLARGMTYKAALAGLPLGGGKSVIMLPKTPFDRAALFTAFGRAIESIGGRYITAEDSGTSTEDMDSIRRGTSHVVGLAKSRGGSGDPSPFTAFGVLRGIQAVAKFSLGRSDLEGLKVSILGVGHVGFPLARLLKEQGAELWVADINDESVRRAQDELGAKAVPTSDLPGLDVDVFAPCALGGSINDQTLPMLRCKAVVGSANNQLLEERHGVELQKRGIVYAPDYLVNAGGLINVALEVDGYDEKKSRELCSAIYDTMYMILERAKAEGSRPEVVADRIVEERLASAKKAKAIA
ncbi:Leu/Phe/Val dehydrogenase [Vulgatibacter incomptus]|uniref:Leucine dehydrogenase n=1 Tax=Vulgatibacter incomptus TaxID=1391653 RepID=A0A0K1P816_9BACT|nr:Glu/Leu/Phe/Val dehydrogenase dimerization domain-containing protein [Vulgatibacter incomptus]AKU89678.1 Leucine dehydrogenase [Vulgatibacter incomptus]